MQESGKRERLRNGEIVELKPGVYGRLNKDNRTLELNSGKILPISQNDQRDLFPENEESLDIARRAEEAERGIKKTPGGEFLYQLGQSSSIGGIKDWYDRFTKTGDQYLRQKEANRRVSSRISEESPLSSGAATIASFIPDLYATRGMSAVKAAPLITTASAGSRILDEPGEVAKEAATSAGLGFILDKGANFLNAVAKRRAESRKIPEMQNQVKAQNLAGEQAVSQANLQQKEAFNLLQERTRNENAARMHQHNLELNARQNRMTQAQNAYEQAKVARESQVLKLKHEAELAKAQRSSEAQRLESEYKAAKASAEAETKRLNEEFKASQLKYQESLKELPKLQKEAQQEYSRNVLQNVQEIEKAFPKNSKIVTDQLGANEFIQETINSSGLAGSREGAQASRILKSLFPEGEFVTAKELSKKYQAIEEAIQRSSPEVQNVLNQYKKFLGKRIPLVIEDTIAYSKIIPSLEKNIQSDVSSILSKMPIGTAGKSEISNLANINLKQAIREITPENFIQKLQSGEISNLLKDRVLTAEDMISHLGMDSARLKKKGLLDLVTRQNAIDAQHSFFVSELGKKLENRLARNEIKAMQAGQEASKKIGKNLKKTYGLAEPVQPPLAPIAPEPIPMPSAPGELPPIQPVQIPAPISPPQAEMIPNKPSLMGEPRPPIPQSFNAAPLPTLPPAQGLAEGTGDLLEKDLLGGKGLVNNPLTKLAGLKYLLGKGAMPLEAGYLGLKGLTSPNQAGEIARMSFKQGGIQAIDMLARKYPSYHNGILENPQERRSLTKEIEDDPEIPLEQKAILQSKVNRGRPIHERLQ